MCYFEMQSCSAAVTTHRSFAHRLQGNSKIVKVNFEKFCVDGKQKYNFGHNFRYVIANDESHLAKQLTVTLLAVLKTTLKRCVGRKENKRLHVHRNHAGLLGTGKLGGLELYI